MKTLHKIPGTPKSMTAAVLLTMIFGPFGLMYASVKAGMTFFGILLGGVLLYFIGIAVGEAFEIPIIGFIIAIFGGTTAFVFLIFGYFICIIWAISETNQHNKKVRYQEYQFMINMNAENTASQQVISSQSSPSISFEEWSKNNPGKSINDYYQELKRNK